MNKYDLPEERHKKLQEELDLLFTNTNKPYNSVDEILKTAKTVDMDMDIAYTEPSVVGIVRKAVAYCLTDVQTNPTRPWEITDPRINSEAMLLRVLPATIPRSGSKLPSRVAMPIEELWDSFMDYTRAGGSALHQEDVIDQIQELSNQQEILLRNYAHLILRYTVFHLGEFGLPNVIAIMPFARIQHYFKSHNQIDDIIEFNSPEPYKPYYKTLEFGIDRRTFIDRDTHIILPEYPSMKIKWLLRALRREGISEDLLFNPTKLSRSHPEPVRLLNECAKGLLYPDYVVANRQMVPSIDPQVINTVEWSGVFNTPETVWELRPTLLNWME